MPDKKNFVNTENFSVEEALGLIRLSRYNYWDKDFFFSNPLDLHLGSR
jgi:hypothetical protein